MSDDDWEESVSAMPVLTAPGSTAQGRIFGMRGRGFRPVEKVVGLQHNRQFNTEDKENSSENFPNSEKKSLKKYMKSSDISQGCGYDKGARKPARRDESNTDSDGIGSSKDEGASKRNYQMPYIPKEIPDEDLFMGGISTGINFSKYDDIEVKVSGENIPKNIEDFDGAGLHPLLLSNIKKSSYTKPTPIQKYALPIIMSGRDMMASAQTGSGKTAAFLIPILSRLLEVDIGPTRDGKAATPQFMVVTPTRELAIQIYIETRKFTHGSKLKTEIVYGGTSLQYQLIRIQGGCNILIGTPGRLKDFVKRSALAFNEVRYFVMDEADKMMDNNFFDDIAYFLNHPTMEKAEDVQILLFSATFPERIQHLASKYLKNYLFLAVGIVGGACTDVEQRFYLVKKHDKRPKLIELLKEHGSGKTVVFVEQKRTADIIAAFLSEKDFPATSMHGDREQILREEALSDFKSGKMDLLVATAVAARGLDIKNVAHVINFDLPSSIDEYVHRIGRTGRVGNRGLASSFFCPNKDAKLAPALVKILAQAQQEVPEFLLTAETCYSMDSPSSSFGGKDVRKCGGFRRGNKGDPLETAPTYEEEVW